MTTTVETPTPSSTVAERVAEIIAELPPTAPPATQSVCKSLLIDVAGLCIAARDADFMKAMRTATDEPGDCTVIASATWSSITRSSSASSDERLRAPSSVVTSSKVTTVTWRPPSSAMVEPDTSTVRMPPGGLPVDLDAVEHLAARRPHRGHLVGAERAPGRVIEPIGPRILLRRHAERQRATGEAMRRGVRVEHPRRSGLDEDHRHRQHVEDGLDIECGRQGGLRTHRLTEPTPSRACAPKNQAAFGPGSPSP